MLAIMRDSTYDYYRQADQRDRKQRSFLAIVASQLEKVIMRQESTPPV
jgi:hypothetical protein